jgi:hypothetical protein
VRRNILLYGAGAVGKSTRLAEASKYVFEQTGKKTRVVNADGGGTRSAFQHLVDRNIAEVWDVDLWDASGIFSTLDFATKGWWPADLDVPNSPLLPAVKEWRKCPGCAKDTGGKSFSMVKVCEKCGMAFGAGEVVPVQRDLVNGAEEVGLYAFEGLTAFGDLMLQRVSTLDPGGGNKILDGEFRVTSPGQQHYGMAQKYIRAYVANSRRIPVDMIMWSALELRSDDDGKPLYGPALPGKKLTSMCVPWFTDVLHLDAIAQKGKNNMVVKDANGMEVLQRKLYLMPHFPPDAPTYKFAAKTSAPMAGKMPVVVDADMQVFFEELKKADARARDTLN